jgi:hypothetical protein
MRYTELAGQVILPGLLGKYREDVTDGETERAEKTAAMNPLTPAGLARPE